MDDNRQNDYRGNNPQGGGHGGHGRDRNRNRYRHHGGGGGGRHGGHGGGGKGRSQRPLLTSAINGAGFSLIAALVVQAIHGGNWVGDLKMTTADLTCWLSSATVAFGLSALISYAAQRVGKMWVEVLSDICFILGTISFIWIALGLNGWV